MISIRKEVSLLPYNTFGIPATASTLVEVDSITELNDFLKPLSRPSSILVLGGGSNTLFVSGDYGTVIRPVLKGIELMEETAGSVLLRAGAGEIWDNFVSWCVDRNYAGVENLSHIPGTVGACPIQNIGAYGVEACNVIEAVETVKMETGETVVFTNEQCRFDYRNSFFKQHKNTYLIVAVQFRLSKNFVPEIKYTDLKAELSSITNLNIRTVRQAIIAIRSRKLPDPAELGNAGSFFKNPAIDAGKATEIIQKEPQAPVYKAAGGLCRISAAWLIQQCGWNGVQIGRVGVHQRQPLVIVNHGHATGKEILEFAEKIINSVNNAFGIHLEPEVNIV
jgi:UDP-N-acetylmuramate dehydrogenase